MKNLRIIGQAIPFFSDKGRLMFKLKVDPSLRELTDEQLATDVYLIKNADGYGLAVDDHTQNR